MSQNHRNRRHPSVSPQVSPPSAAAAQPTPAVPIRLFPPHVDYCSVGLYIAWPNWPTLHTDLDRLRAGSRDNRPTPASFGPYHANVLASRLKMYPFRLQTPDALISIADRGLPDNFPNVLVQPRAYALCTRGLSVIADTDAFLGAMGGRERWNGSSTRIPDPYCRFEHTVQRVDLALDLIPAAPLSPELLYAQACTRMTGSRRYFDDSGRFTGIQFGNRNLVVKVYNKFLEIGDSPNPWYWALRGIPPCPNLWRVELQIRRPLLLEFGIDRLATLADSLSGLWHRITTTEFTLREPGNPDVSRRPMTPLWEMVVQAGASLGGSVAELCRRPRPAPQLCAEWYVNHAASDVMGYAAANGIFDYQAAVQALAAALAARPCDDSWRQKVIAKRIKAGVDIPAAWGGAPSAPVAEQDGTRHQAPGETP